MDSNLIVIKQLPVIEEHLQKMKLEIEQRVDMANSLKCSEDTRKEVKKVRTQLNKDLEDFENRRKEVKKKIEDRTSSLSRYTRKTFQSRSKQE